MSESPLFREILKSLDVNWGPWSDQTMSGAPVWQKTLSDEVGHHGVVAHVNNVSPVSVVVDNDEEVVWV